MTVDQKAIAARSHEQAFLGRLGQLPLFVRLSSRHLQLIRKVARPRPLSSGEVLWEAGAVAQGLFILLKGRLERRRGGSVLGEVTPIGTAGEIGMLTGQPQAEEVVSTSTGLALHVPGEIMELVLSRDMDLYQRLSRNAIGWLSAQLVEANQAQADFARRRNDLQRVIDEAQHELNDARMLHSMRG